MQMQAATCRGIGEERRSIRSCIIVEARMLLGELYDGVRGAYEER